MAVSEGRETPLAPTTASQSRIPGTPSSPSRRRRLRTVLVLLCVGAVVLTVVMLTDSGLRLVSLADSVPPEAIVKLDPSNSPTTVEADGRWRIHWSPAIEGAIDQVTLPYDRLLWSATKMPYVRANEAAGERDLVLLDTGLPHGTVVTLDAVARRGLPALMAESLAYVDSLDVGALTFRDFPALVLPETWEYRVLSLSVYRLSGWVMGIAFLGKTKHLCFDNTECEVTFGVEASFEPDPAWQWAEFPLTIPKGRPTATLPVAGIAVDLLIDSAGGPRLVLTPADWKAIAGNLDVVKHSAGEFPTWGGFQAVDQYKVRELTVGPVVLEDAWVWVRPESPEETHTSWVGLGPFSDTVVVFDFERSRLLIRTGASDQAQPEQ